MSILKKIHPFYYFSALYMVFSLVLGMILLNGLVLFLGWNMFLATVVFFLSQVFLVAKSKKAHPIVLVLIFLIYLLFFPNALYILTDFIHFQNYPFFTNYANIYSTDIENWLVFLHITIGALYAVKLGISSIFNLEPVIKPIVMKSYYPLLGLFFILSSIGIYIGRFLRFNSWHIILIFDMISEILSNFVFFAGFVAIFFILHCVCYLLFSKLGIKDYNRNVNINGGIK